MPDIFIKPCDKGEYQLHVTVLFYNCTNKYSKVAYFIRQCLKHMRPCLAATLSKAEEFCVCLQINKYVLSEILNHSRLRHPHIVKLREVITLTQFKKTDIYPSIPFFTQLQVTSFTSILKTRNVSKSQGTTSSLSATSAWSFDHLFLAIMM